MDIRNDRQKGLNYTEIGKKYHLDPRTAKRYAVSETKPAYQLSGQKNQSERIKQIQRYNQALRSLYQIKSTASINANHANLEKYFTDGLISPSLVIETHRQMIQLIESRNVQELTAWDALWRLYVLQGKVVEAKL